MSVVPSRAAVRATLPGIELLRFFCACAVLIWHYQHFSYVANAAADFSAERQPWYGALGLLYRYGFYGVQVFWCISGFIFFWKYAEAIRTGHVTPGRFFLLRFSRLYPLHVATLLLVALGQALYYGGHQYYFVYRDNGAAGFALQLGMASHWLFPLTGFSFNGPVWSVSLEVLAYLVFFLYARKAGTGWWSTVGAALALLVVRRYRDWPLLECLLYFYLGGVLAIAYGRAPAWPAVLRRALLLAAALALAALTAAAWDGGPDSVYVVMAGTPALIWLCLHVAPPGAAVAGLLERLGNLTYSSYLLHFPVQLSVALACGWLGRPVPFYSPKLLTSFIGSTLVLAYLCHYRYERPVQQWLRRAGGRPLAASRLSSAPVSAGLPD